MSNTLTSSKELLSIVKDAFAISGISFKMSEEDFSELTKYFTISLDRDILQQKFNFRMKKI